MPALTDGDRKIWEANAIMAYLARAAGSDLLPSDDRQIEVTRWLSWNADHFTRHAGNLYFQHIIKPHFGIGEPGRQGGRGSNRLLQAVRTGAERSSARAEVSCSETQLTIADFAVAVTLPYADKANIPVGGYSEIERWHARLNELPGWREPFPEVKSAAA